MLPLPMPVGWIAKLMCGAPLSGLPTRPRSVPALTRVPRWSAPPARRGCDSLLERGSLPAISMLGWSWPKRVAAPTLWGRSGSA